MPSEDQRGALTRRDVLRRLAALGGLIQCSLLPVSARADSLRVGAPAPPATLMTLDGARLSTTALKGNVIILTFWATWCEPCREELPLLSSYAKEHAASGLRVLGFSLDDAEDLPKVRAAARTLEFPVGLLGSDRLEGYGRIWRIPVNFTIDRQGRLVDNGWKDKKPVWTQERLERIVTPLLAA